MDADMTIADADRIGFAALHAGNAMAGILNRQSDAFNGYRIGDAFRSDIQRLVCCLMYKAHILDRWIERAGEKLVVVGDPNLTPVSGLSMAVGRFDTMFAALAMSRGIDVVCFAANIPAGAQPNGDFLRVTAWTRLTTLLNMPRAVLHWRWLQRRRRWARPAGNGVAAVVLSSNELIEETALALSRKGVFLTYAPGEGLDDGENDTAEMPDPISLQSVDAATREGAKRSGVTWAGSMECIPQLVTSRLGKAIRYVPAAQRRARRYVQLCNGYKANGPLAVVANFISTPADILLAQTLKRDGIPLFVVEHGAGAGIDLYHRSSYDAGYWPTGEIPVSHNPVQHRELVAKRGKTGTKGIVAGAPRVLRHIGFRPLQRAIVRRNLGVKDKLLCWVTGLYPNNMQRQPHYYLDGPYHQLRKEITYDVLANAPYEVLLKLYPTYRYTDGDPFADRMQLPSNCRSEMLIDFRNFRAAADVTLIDEPGSGLAWCWGLDAPLIYLDTQMRLLPEAVRAFSEALFYVDTQSQDWKEQLLSLVTMPYGDLVFLYKSKEKVRKEVGYEYVFGPGGNSGQRAADFILGTLCGASLPEA